MAFLFKSKKHQEREKDRVLNSRDGPQAGSQSSAGSAAARVAKDEKSSLQRSTPTGSLNSLDNTNSNDASGSPDQAAFSRRPPTSDQNGQPPSTDLQFRNGPGPTLGNPSMSLYPWSQRRLTYTSSTMSPFPRYGAAVNATASKEGDIYVMGGLINSQTVKGDLWMIEAGGNMSCYQLATTAEGPSPRVGHASLLVGNAFIVYGGDTKIDESDVLDETLYLLNTSTRQWSRALPAGARPSGRYGHSLTILGSKIYIFGGQVEGFFMNDLTAFDLNQLQMPNNRWEMLIPNDTASPSGKVPPARTNHSMVSYNDKMYLFGGTNGFQWFNDVWCYDPATNSWSQLDCIGYIPVEREGHAAALVDDVMYIFGGRTEDGSDLGDLAAFRITSRRWYTFQNMGPSPSPRSGHSMTTVGKAIVVLGGEPSSATTAVNDLALVYVLDTNKIRYPNDAQAPASSQNKAQNGVRRPSNPDRNMPSRDGSQGPHDHKRLVSPGAAGSPTNGFRSPMGPDINGGRSSASPVNGNSKLPRVTGPSPPAGPPPQGQPPKPVQIATANATRARNASLERAEYAGSPVNSGPNQHQAPVRAMSKDSDSSAVNGRRTPTQQGARSGGNAQGASSSAALPSASGAAASAATMATRNMSSGSSKSRSSRQTGQGSLDSTSDQVKVSNHRPTSPPPPSRQGGPNPLARRSSGRNSQTVAILKELDSARNRNAWYASELELARKAGYSPNATLSPLLESRGVATFDDSDKPLVEALLAMRTELANVQASVDKQAILAAKQIAEADKQRDAAIQEAVYAKAKLAAHLSNNATVTSQLDSSRDVSDRVSEMGHKLASALNMQKELQLQLERATAENAAEKRARQLSDETLLASQRRMTELESYKQETSHELGRIKAELHVAQRDAREQSVVAAEAVAESQMLRIDKDNFERQFQEATGNAKQDGESFVSLREAIVASEATKSVLEEKLQQERSLREAADVKLASIKGELEARTAEIETMTQRLRDAEELAEKHAQEARTHRQAVLSGLDTITARAVSNTPQKADVERIAALVVQLETARSLVKKYQNDADTAVDRLRSAEERIAGLEAYQEQASREGVSIRRQLQAALRDTQTLQARNTDLQHQLANQQLETNAVTVQHNTLKDILSERGISPTNSARARDSPRGISPEHEARVRELEQQLASTAAAHEETKQTMAIQASESESAYREKLTQLENDYQSAVHYVKGTEKMLKQLKEQLTRYKTENTKLKAEVEELEEASFRASSAPAAKAPAEWEEERGALSQRIEALRGELETSKAQLEAQLQTVRQGLEETKLERDSAVASNKEVSSQLAATRLDIEQLRRDNTQLERRAQDAEQKVGLLLDQVESSVGNYRRRSRLVTSMNSDQLREVAAGGVPTATNGLSTTSAAASAPGHSRQGSSETGSAYGDTRNSVALDNLANELETLRSHWEATNKNYRLSNAFDFETTTTSNGASGGGSGGSGGAAGSGTAGSAAQKDGKDEGGLGLSESLADWRKRLDG